VSEPRAVGVLVSGSGSNLGALLAAAALPDCPFRIVRVISNVPGVFALDRAAAAGVPAAVISHRGRSRAEFETEVVADLRAAGVEWVALAGFMRILGGQFLSEFEGRVLNIHPALLPAFPGTHAQGQALARGVRIAGATVHWVDAGTDTGPILLQGATPVLPTDTEDSLKARILRLEHRLFPQALQLVCSGQARLVDGVVFLNPNVGESLALWEPA
jgi:phosphoribosylglycinamide formyltransferase-1